MYKCVFHVVIVQTFHILRIICWNAMDYLALGTKGHKINDFFLFLKTSSFSYFLK